MESWCICGCQQETVCRANPGPVKQEACLGADGQYLAGREAGPSLEEALEFQKESHSFST